MIILYCETVVQLSVIFRSSPMTLLSSAEYIHIGVYSYIPTSWGKIQMFDSKFFRFFSKMLRKSRFRKFHTILYNFIEKGSIVWVADTKWTLKICWPMLHFHWFSFNTNWKKIEKKRTKIHARYLFFSIFGRTCGFGVLIFQFQASGTSVTFHPFQYWNVNFIFSLKLYPI